MAMGCTVRELLGRIDSHELSEWQAYYTLDPFGEERADLRAGIIASVIANVNRDPKKGPPFKPSQFMPLIEEEEKVEQTQEVQMSVLASIARAAKSQKKDAL